MNHQEYNDNLNELIDWNTVKLDNPELDTCLLNIQQDIKTLKESLEHLNSGASSLPFLEIENYKESLETSLEESIIMKDLLEKAIGMRELTSLDKKIS